MSVPHRFWRDNPRPTWTVSRRAGRARQTGGRARWLGRAWTFPPHRRWTSRFPQAPHRPDSPYGFQTALSRCLHLGKGDFNKARTVPPLREHIHGEETQYCNTCTYYCFFHFVVTTCTESSSHIIPQDLISCQGQKTQQLCQSMWEQGLTGCSASCRLFTCPLTQRWAWCQSISEQFDSHVRQICKRLKRAVQLFSTEPRGWLGNR